VITASGHVIDVVRISAMSVILTDNSMEFVTIAAPMMMMRITMERMRSKTNLSSKAPHHQGSVLPFHPPTHPLTHPPTTTTETYIVCCFF